MDDNLVDLIEAYVQGPSQTSANRVREYCKYQGKDLSLVKDFLDEYTVHGLRLWNSFNEEYGPEEESEEVPQPDETVPGTLDPQSGDQRDTSVDVLSTESTDEPPTV